jgi:hypothetical protein
MQFLYESDYDCNSKVCYKDVVTYNVAGTLDNGRPQHAREEKSCEEAKFSQIDSEEQQETKM